MGWTWRQVSRTTRLTAAGATAAGLLALGLIHLLPSLGPFFLGRPSWCSMKIVFGIPCLACRGTRSAFALAHGEVAQAFTLNPLACIAVLATAGWLAKVTLTGRTLSPTTARPWSLLGWLLLGAALLANWAYVIVAGG